MIKNILLVILIIFVFSFCLHAKTLSIAAIDWCPQICLKQDNSGYVVDIIKQVFEDTDYQLDITFYPWSRAIKLVRAGKVDALLSPAKNEAPDLLYPANEVGIQRMCFFINSSSNWQYQNDESLKGMQIGIAQDASLAELTDYQKRHPEQFQVQPYLGRFIKQNAAKLRKKRIDSFIFTHNATWYELNKLGIQEHYRNAGCINHSNIYIAFSDTKNNAEIKKMVNIFDEKIVLMHSNGSIENIMKKYDLQSWKKL